MEHFTHFEIERINSLGFIAWAVIDSETEQEICRFDTYCDAVDFVSFMNDIGE